MTRLGFPTMGHTDTPPWDARRVKILELRRLRWSYVRIGREVGLSAERVRQIVHGEGLGRRNGSRSY